MQKLDPKGEKILASVHPDLQAITNLAAKLSSRPFTIVQGKRTLEYQKHLYSIGRRGIAGEKPVTWTMNSKHLSGNAIDFAPLVNGKPSYDESLYPPIAATFQAAAKQLGLGIVWGGKWKVRDWGHIELDRSKNKDPFARPEPAVARTFDLAKIPEDDRPGWAVAYMEHLGWAKHQAAAIIANGVWESGGNKTNDIIPTALGGEGSHGAWQWRGARYLGRNGLLSFAYGYGRSSADLEVQLLFVDHELKTTEKRAGGLLKNASTLEEAVEAAISYCRPKGFTWDNPRAGHGFDERLEIARGLMK